MTHRNIVICFDGTNNEFGKEDTNVVRVARVLKRNPQRQLLYYDPGVGTLPEPGWATKIGQKISTIYGLAVGAGMIGNVEEAYSYLMNTWQPNDRIFIFGFSRGAYSARVLAGLLHTVGLLPSGNQNLVPYAMRLYKGIRKEGKEGAGRWRNLCADFRKTFSRPIFEGDDQRRCLIHFLGIWDAVSSVGWFWNPATFPYTFQNPSVQAIRHAVAIDERRWFFRQNLIRQATPEQDLKEAWFPGVHSDVGGGYPDSKLWQVSFEWMIEEVKKFALEIDEQQLRIILGESVSEAWKEAQHESLEGAWHLAELVPKRAWNSIKQRKELAFGLWRNRLIPNGALIHKSVLQRIRETGYKPKNMSKEFIEQVLNLNNIPDFLALI